MEIIPSTVSVLNQCEADCNPTNLYSTEACEDVVVVPSPTVAGVESFALNPGVVALASDSVFVSVFGPKPINVK